MVLNNPLGPLGMLSRDLSSSPPTMFSTIIIQESEKRYRNLNEATANNVTQNYAKTSMVAGKTVDNLRYGVIGAGANTLSSNDNMVRNLTGTMGKSVRVVNDVLKQANEGSKALGERMNKVETSVSSLATLTSKVVEGVDKVETFVNQMAEQASKAETSVGKAEALASQIVEQSGKTETFI